MIRTKNVFWAFILAGLLGCDSPGSAYVGRWQNIQRADDRIEILRDGDGFQVKGTTTLRGRYHEGILKVDTPQGTVPYTYLRDKDVLAVGPVEYRRFK